MADRTLAMIAADKVKLLFDYGYLDGRSATARALLRELENVMVDDRNHPDTFCDVLEALQDAIADRLQELRG